MNIKKATASLDAATGRLFEINNASLFAAFKIFLRQGASISDKHSMAWIVLPGKKETLRGT